MESSASTGSNINGGLIKFKNKKCYCGKKASVRISESQKNPSKLYYTCDVRECNFYCFWDPNHSEFNSQHTESARNVEDEIKAMDARIQTMEKLFGIRMQHLESTQGWLRVIMLVNIVFFGISMAIFIANVIKLN